MESRIKIGIITFHKEINYGANLQAYALLTFLNETYDFCEAEIIDYIPNSAIDTRSWKRKLLHLAKVLLITSAKNEAIKKKRFQSFQNKFYKLSSFSFRGDGEIRDFILPYDIVISGSDQVLNITLSEQSFAYYLPFKNVSKISYGSSFGRERISDLEKWAILKYLPDFDNLSFREESGFNIVNSIIPLSKKNIVVDPVFLLNEDKWKRLIHKNRMRAPYVLIYALEQSDWFESAIKFVSIKYPLYKIVYISGADCKISIPRRYIDCSACGPTDFLSLLSGASLVVTNSFHGLCFSFIFRKNVYCCSHSTKNTRLLNLVKMADQEGKMIVKNTNFYQEINGSDAITAMSEHIEFSKEYLKNSLVKNYDR